MKKPSKVTQTVFNYFLIYFKTTPLRLLTDMRMMMNGKNVSHCYKMLGKFIFFFKPNKIFCAKMLKNIIALKKVSILTKPY